MKVSKISEEFIEIFGGLREGSTTFISKAQHDQECAKIILN